MKTKLQLFKKLFLIIGLVLTSFISFGQITVTNPVFPNEIETCGEVRTFTFDVVNASGTAVSGELLLDLPSGAYYEDNSINGGPTASDVSNLNKPKFNLTVPANGTVTVSFDAYVTCGFVVTNEFDFVFDGVALATPQVINQLNTPNLVITDVSPSAPTKTVGETFTRVITIKQNSPASNELNSFSFTDSHTSSIDITNIQLLGPGGNVISGGTFDISSSKFDIDAAAIQAATGGADGYFNADEEIKLVETVKFVDCNDTNSSLKVYFGCTPPNGSLEVCDEYTESAIVNPSTGTGSMNISFDVVQKFDICQNLILEYTITNDGNAPLYDIKLPMGFANDTNSSIPRVNATHMFDIVGSTIGSTAVGSVTSGTGVGVEEAWYVLVSDVPSDPDGANSGLEDINGDGKFELPAGESFTIRIEVDFDESDYIAGNYCTNPFSPDYLLAANSTWIMGYIFKSMCGTETRVNNFHRLTGTLYRAQAFTATVDNPNLFDGDEVYLNALYESNFNLTTEAADFFANGGSISMQFTLPDGLNFSTNTASPVYWNNSNVTLQTSTAGKVMTITALETPNGNWRIPVVADCSNPTNNPVKVKIFLEPGPTASCANTLEMGCIESAPSINFMCTPCLTNNINRYEFTVERTSFGWLDADNDRVADDNVTRADASTPNINLKAARSLEEVTFTLKGIVQNTLTTDYAEFEYVHSGSAGATDKSKPYFNPISATVTRTPASGGPSTSVSGVPVTEIFQAGEIHTMQVALDALQSSLGTFEVDDVIEVVVITKTAKDLPDWYEPVVNLRGQWITILPNNTRSACFLLDNFYLEKSSVKNRAWFRQTRFGCDTFYTRMMIAYSDGAGHDDVDNFPNEVHSAYIKKLSQRWLGHWSLVPGTVRAIKNDGYAIEVLDDSDITITYDGTYTVFTYTNDGTLPFVDDYMKWADYGVTFELTPDCGVPDGVLNTSDKIAQSVEYIEYYYADPSDHVEESHSNRAPGHTVIYTNLRKQFSAITPIYQATSLGAKWDVRVENTTNYTDPNKDIQNAWLLIESQSSGITPDALQEIDGSGNPIGAPIALTRVGSSLQWFAQLGNIPGGDYRDFRILADLTSCTNVGFVVTMGNNCSRYPEIIGDELLYTSSSGNFMCDTTQLTLTLDPKVINLETSLTQPSGDQDFCDNIAFSLNVKNLGASRAYNNKVILEIPEGLIYSPTTSELVFNGSTVVIDDPVASSGYLTWTLSPTLTELGAGVNETTIPNEYNINFQAKTSCGFSSGSKFNIEATANSSCGVEDFSSVFSNKITITGAPSTSNIYTIDLDDSNDNITCNNNGIIQVDFLHRSGAPIQPNEYIEIILPNNFNYEANLINIQNASGVTFISDTPNSPSVSKRTIRFTLPTGVVVNTNIIFSFEVSIIDNTIYDCDEEVDISALTLIEGSMLTCDGQSCSSTSISANSDIHPISIKKPEINLGIGAASATYNTTTQDEVISVELTFQNVSDFDLPAGAIVSLFKDTNANGNFDDADTVVDTYTTTTSVSASSTVTLTATFSATANEACNLYVGLSTKDQCVCTTAPVPVSISTLEGIAGDDVEVCEGVDSLIGEASIGYTYEWTSSDATALTYLSATDVAQPTFNYSGASLTVNTTFTYTLSVTRPEGCIATDNVEVTVFTKPTISGPVEVDVNQNITLIGSGAPTATATWSINPATGIASIVSSGTTATLTGTQSGTVEISFTNAGGCNATYTVQVKGLQIDAVDDDYTPTPINGIVGGTTSSVLENDTLNGVKVDPDDITLTPGTPPSPTNGSISMDTDGTIIVAPNTTPGVYSMTYTICDNLNPANCDTATATVLVEMAIIDAVDDDYTPTPVSGIEGGTLGNILDNDTLNGVLLDPNDVHLTPGFNPQPDEGSITMNPDGTITVAPNTTGGIYVMNYTICEKLNPANCDTAVVTVVVKSPEINAADDDYSSTPIQSEAGGELGNILDNDTLNGAVVNPDEIHLTPGSNPTPSEGSIVMNPDGTLSVSPNTTPGVYTMTYTICEKVNPKNCDSAIVTIKVEANSSITLDKQGFFQDENSDGNAQSGETIIYIFTVENTGSVALSNVHIDDSRIGVTDLPTTPSDLEAGEQGTASYSYTLTAEDIKAGEVLNVAYVEGTTSLGDTVTSSDNATVEFNTEEENGEVSVEKTADREMYEEVGEVITYSIVVKNTGNVLLTNVNVKDPLTGLDRVVEELAVAASVSFTTEYTVTQADLDAGFVNNVVTAQGTIPSGSTVSDTDTATVKYDSAGGEENGEVSVEKTADKESFEEAGEVITYSIVVTNTGNVVLTNVVVSDPLTGLDRVVEELAVDASVSFTTEYTVTQSDIDTGFVNNVVTAEVTTPSGSTVSDTDTETVRYNDPIGARGELNVEKTADRETFGNIGEKITYTIVVKNTGNVLLTNVNVKDPLTGLNETVSELAVGESIEFTVYYIATREDITNKSIVNIVFAEGELPDGTTIGEDKQVLVEFVCPRLRDNFSIQQIITPNSDGLNDTWEVTELELRTLCNDANRIMIFNRWGAKVYEKRNYMSDSDRFSGYSTNSLDFQDDELLPAGVYFYVIEINNSVEKTGYLYLLSEE